MQGERCNGRAKTSRAISKRSARGKGARAKRPADPEAQEVVPIAGGAGTPAAVGRAEVLWKAAPSTAADNTATCISTFCPGAAICGRCSAIVVMPGVFDPFPDIAMHVMETEGIWRKLSHWGRVNPLIPPLGLAPAALVCAMDAVALKDSLKNSSVPGPTPPPAEPVEAASFTITEFCRRNRFGRSTYYQLAAAEASAGCGVQGVGRWR